ncbi:MAG: nitroreductase/quinone reductase family protein [Conexibacteraceae bacterium]|nr:nitroreductase/quinone reductase family protein [Conexibacteraceae bacterium]
MISDRAGSALQQDQTVDITTIGRRSGRPRRLEIWFHNLDGHIYITGLPGQRGWYANLLAQPEFTFHLKQSAQEDLPARARPIVEAAERERVLGEILTGIGRQEALADWLAGAPLVEVEFMSR